MAVSLEDQVNLAIGSIAQGDVDSLASMLEDPSTVTPDELRTTAQKLGIKNGFLSAAVNTFSDPVVLLSFYMSRAFPFKDWMLGTVPKRYIGAANEFSGLSAVVRPVEGYFRGTNISKMTALSIRREAEVRREGAKIFDLILPRKNWGEEAPIVSLLLEGQNHPAATPELVKLSGQIREHMDNLWGFLRKAHRIEGGLTESGIERARAGPFPKELAPRYLRDYLPHIPLTTNETMIETNARAALARIAKSKGVAQALQVRGDDLARVWSVDQTERLSSTWAGFQSFMNSAGAAIYSPRLFHRERHGLQLQSAAGQQLFVTDLNQVLQRYIHSVAKTYALGAPITDQERLLAWGRGEGWRVPSNEPLLVQIVNEGLEATGAKFRSFGIAGTEHQREVLSEQGQLLPLKALKSLVRNIKGMQSEDEILFGGMINRALKSFHDSAGQFVDKKHLGWLTRAVEATERGDSYRATTNALTSHFYASTLGLNTWSTMQNFFQPIITTMPSIGIGPTIRGYGVLKDRLPKYVSEVVAASKMYRGAGARPLQALHHAIEEGFHKTFPELANNGVRINPTAFDINEEELIRGGVFKNGTFGRVDDFYKLVLTPFQQAEVANQISTFYGAKDRLRNAMKLGEWSLPAGTAPEMVETALDFEAANAVNALQFRPGPGGRSLAQAYLPGPLRMFTGFATRFANFVSDSTVRGAMSAEAINQAKVMDWIADPLLSTEAGRAGAQKFFSAGTGRNLGVLSRLVMYSRIMTHGMRDVLGVDVSGSLGLAAPYLNYFQSDQPFAPLPMSPMPQAVHGLYSAATTRDMKRMQPLVLPGVGEMPVPKTLFPAGLAISRFARALNQFRPDMGGFVDNDERLMYRGNTTDMVLAGLGIPLEKQKRMRDKVDTLQANRNAIRQYRRRYANAAMNMDYGTMDQLSGQFQKAFPDMPPLAVSAKDLRRYRENATIPVVSRMIRTMGQGARYLESDIYEYDPDLVAPPLGLAQVLGVAA